MGNDVSTYVVDYETLQAHFKYKKEEDVSFQIRPLCLVIRLGAEPYIFYR